MMLRVGTRGGSCQIHPLEQVASGVADLEYRQYIVHWLSSLVYKRLLLVVLRTHCSCICIRWRNIRLAGCSGFIRSTIMAIVHKIEVTKYQVYRTSHSNLPLYRDLAFTTIYIAWLSLLSYNVILNTSVRSLPFPDLRHQQLLSTSGDPNLVPSIDMPIEVQLAFRGLCYSNTVCANSF